MKNLKLLVTFAFIAALTSCANSDDYGTPDLSNECISIPKTKEVADITNIASASTTQYTTLDNVTDYIEAYVTSSDEGGNFYKSISMMSLDGLKGFSMPVDNYNLYTEFEPGRKVTIKLDKDTYFKKLYGSTVIGATYNSNDVGRISGVNYKKVILRSCENVNEDEIVKNLTISQAKSDQYLNMLIEFDAVQFDDGSLGKKYYDPSLPSFGGATNHNLKDVDGTSVIVRVSQYANFATKNIPSGNGKLRGVMTKYNSDYQFMIRTEKDINLNNARIVPFFEETFSSNFNNWTKFSVSGAQVWSLDTQYGNPGSCAKMSGFANSTNNANEDWLISPAINMANINSAILTYETATKFPGNALQVYISTNYAGSGNPTGSNWTLLNGILSPSTGNYAWTNSGLLDISSYAGNTIYIGFKYTSTTSAASTWEVDNVKIDGN